MLLAALAASLILTSDAPQPSSAAVAAEPAHAGPAMVKKRVCKRAESTSSSRTAKRVCETVMVPASEADAGQMPGDAGRDASKKGGA